MDPTLVQFLSTVLGGIIASTTAWYVLKKQTDNARNERIEATLTAANDSFRGLMVEMDFNLNLHPPGYQGQLWVAFQRDAFTQARPYLKSLPEKTYDKLQRAINQMALYNSLVVKLDNVQGNTGAQVGLLGRISNSHKELMLTTSDAYHAMDVHLNGTGAPVLPPATP